METRKPIDAAALDAIKRRPNIAEPLRLIDELERWIEAGKRLRRFQDLRITGPVIHELNQIESQLTALKSLPDVRLLVDRLERVRALVYDLVWTLPNSQTGSRSCRLCQGVDDTHKHANCLALRLEADLAISGLGACPKDDDGVSGFVSP